MKIQNENAFNELMIKYIEDQKKLGYNNQDIIFNISKKYNLSITDVKKTFGSLIFEKQTLRKLLKENSNYDFFNAAKVTYIETPNKHTAKANVEFLNGTDYTILLDGYGDFEKLLDKLSQKKIINNTIRVNAKELGILSSWMERFLKIDGEEEEDEF
jgi:hypothetical protein